MTMELLIGCLLALEDSDIVGEWLRCFDASTKANKLKDKVKGGENKVTDLFIALQELRQLEMSQWRIP